MKQTFFRRVCGWFRLKWFLIHRIMTTVPCSCGMMRVPRGKRWIFGDVHPDRSITFVSHGTSPCFIVENDDPVRADEDD